MVKMLSKIASAVALLGAASASHAYLLMEVAQTGGTSGNESFLCQSDTGAGCGTLQANFTIAGRTTRVYSFEGLSTVGARENTFTIKTGGGLDDEISFSGWIGDYEVNTTSGTSNRPGTPEAANTTTSALAVKRDLATGGALANLFVGLRAFNFSLPSGELKSLFGSSSISSAIGGSSGTIGAKFWADPGNGGGTVTPLIGCTYALLPDASCSSPTIEWTDPPAGGFASMFSLRSEHTFLMTAGSGFTGTTSLTAGRLPEPATLGLVGVALLAAASVARRKRA